MRSTWLSLCLIVLSVASCGFPPLSELADGGGADDGATGDGEPPPLSLELLAGNIGGPGNADGVSTAARFNGPAGVTADSAGNIYVADWGNHAVRKVTSAGAVSTLAPAGLFGTADPFVGFNGCFNLNPLAGIAIDTTGNIYIADGSNQTIRKITAAGGVTTLAGTTGLSGSANGIGAAARFDTPNGVAVDSAGNVYVSDHGNSTIRKITAAGVVSTMAGTAGMSGTDDGTGSAARFSSPAGVAVDGAGNVYVSDGGAIRKVTPAGVVSTLATGFVSLAGMAVDGAGNIYVADYFNHTIHKVTAAGAVSTLAGAAAVPGSADGVSAAARFNSPAAVAVDSANNVYVADCGNSTIRKVAAGGVMTLAGKAAAFGYVDGPGVMAEFGSMDGVAADSAGNVLIPDLSNAVLRKVDTNGNVTTLAGGAPARADGTGAAAGFEGPSGVAVDGAGNAYVTDQSDLTIRKVTSAGVVTTLAGTPHKWGSADGVGAAASFRLPFGVAVDNAGNIYVTDETGCTIRKVTAGGVVTTLAGTAGMTGSADGSGAAARFGDPVAVAVDGAGNAYVTDSSNHIIRKITADGVVTTLAGTPGAIGSTDGVGAAARFNYLGGVAVNNAGNIYVVDGNSTIRKVTPTGTTTTIAGTIGVRGILLGKTPRFAFPNFLAIIADSIVVVDGSAILLLRHGAR